MEHARALQTRRLLVLLSAVLITCCVIICSILVFITLFHQKSQIEQIETQNDSTLTTIKAKEGIREILTIQNQISSLNDLHQDKIAVDRLFGTGEDDLAYLQNLIPDSLIEDNDTTFNSINFDFSEESQGKFSISGTTASHRSAAKLEATVRYIGFADCTEKNRDERVYPFQINPITTSSLNTESDDDVTYSIDGIFSQSLFNKEIDENKLKLLVPSAIVSSDFIKQPKHKCTANPNANNLDPNFDPTSTDDTQPEGN